MELLNLVLVSPLRDQELPKLDDIDPIHWLPLLNYRFVLEDFSTVNVVDHSL